MGINYETVGKAVMQEIKETPIAKLHWCSFVDDTGSLGVTIVMAYGAATASMATHAMGINPGGEMLCIELPDHYEGQIKPEFINVLIPADRAKALSEKLL